MIYLNSPMTPLQLLTWAAVSLVSTIFFALAATIFVSSILAMKRLVERYWSRTVSGQVETVKSGSYRGDLQ